MVARIALIAVPWLLAVIGCTGTHREVAPPPDRERKSATVRIHLAADQPQTGFTEMKGKNGERIYVSPTCEFDQTDVVAARALHSEKRSMLLIELNHLAAQELYLLTRAHLGARLAVFVDDELICAPQIDHATASGQIRLIGFFPREKTEELAAALTRRGAP